MKKLVVTSILVLMTLFGVLAACKAKDREEAIKLSTPQVELIGDTVTWSADPLADKFEISVSGMLYYMENSMESKKLENGQSFKIRAIGDGKNYLTGDWSSEIVYAPTETEKSFTVTWKNDNVVLETDNNVSVGMLPSYDGATPEKISDAQYSYIFTGWSPSVTEVSGDVIYVAQFDAVPRNYTVTFYNEDRVSVLDTVTVEYGGTAIYTSAIPSKVGTEEFTYIFDKWISGDNPDVEDPLANIIADRAVYASYKSVRNVVNVRIISSNSTYGTVSESILYDVPYNSPVFIDGHSITVNGKTVTATANAATAKDTFAFVGWTTPSVVGNDTVIIANFSHNVNGYTVTWKNGDSILEVDSGVLYGTTPVYNGSTPTKNGDAHHSYTFAGWFTEDGKKIDEDSEVIQDITLHARWSYTVSYDGNGATGGVTEESTHIYGDESPLSANGFVRKYTVTFKYNYNQDFPSSNLPDSVVEVEYSFAGWAKTADGNVEYNGGQNVTDMTDMTLCAKWNPSSTVLPVPTRTGYVFLGWYTAASGGTAISGTTYTPEKNIVLYARWSYTVSYDGNGATGGITEASTHIYGDESPLSANGFVRKYTVTFKYNYNQYFPSLNPTDSVVEVEYSFAGWAKTADGNAEYSGGQNVTDMIDMTLCAKWNPESAALPVPTRTGYVFLGWYTDASGGTEISGTTYTPEKNVVLYAHWRPVEYTVKYYNMYEDIGLIGEQKFVYGGNCSCMESYETQKYRLEYWEVWTDSGKEIYYPGSEFIKPKDGAVYEFYAVLKLKGITINFAKGTPYFTMDMSKLVEVKGNMDQVYVTAEDGDYYLPECEFEAEGYKFVAWEWNGKRYSSGDKFPWLEIFTDNTEITFEAIWEKI